MGKEIHHMEPVKQSLATRMKGYETTTTSLHLDPLLPAIMRLDGHSFSKFTARFAKPFDERIHLAMVKTCTDLLGTFPAATLAYTQSDEITLVFPKGMESFNGRAMKIATLAASFCGVHFYSHLRAAVLETPDPAVTGLGSAEDTSVDAKAPPLPYFDARIHNVPTVEEALNNLLWRCRGDAIRNSVSGFARTLFTTSQLHKKTVNDMLEMMASEKGVVFEEAVPKWALEGSMVKREQYEFEARDEKTGRTVMTVRTRTRCVDRGVREFDEHNLKLVVEKFWPAVED